MTQSSIWWTTGGAGDGAAPYTQAQVTAWLARMYCNDVATQGVVPDYPKAGTKELAITVAGTTLTVAPGAAMVAGIPYESTNNEPVVVPTPLLGATGHRVVLRADYGARTVRLALLSSSDGVAAVPAPTQSAGTTWDISLATLTITTGGAISLTDARQWLRFNTRVSAAMLDDLAVTTAKLADGAVTTAKAADLAVTTAKLADLAVTTAKLGSNQVTEGKIAAGAVTASRIAAGGVTTPTIADLAVTTAKLDNLSVTAPKIAANAVTTPAIVDLAITLAKLAHPPRRQGGDASSWDGPGTTNYTPASMRMQMGVVTLNSGTSTATVTFPAAFAGPPLVICQSSSTTALVDSIVVSARSSTQMTVSAYIGGFGAGAVPVTWLAIGPA